MLKTFALHLLAGLAVATVFFLLRGASIEMSAMTGLLVICSTTSAWLISNSVSALRSRSEMTAHAGQVAFWFVSFAASCLTYVGALPLLMPDDIGRGSMLLAVWIAFGVAAAVTEYAEKQSSAVLSA